MVFIHRITGHLIDDLIEQQVVAHHVAAHGQMERGLVLRNGLRSGRTASFLVPLRRPRQRRQQFTNREGRTLAQRQRVPRFDQIGQRVTMPTR